MGIKHKKRSSRGDTADKTIVQPSDWNEEHEVDGLLGALNDLPVEFIAGVGKSTAPAKKSFWSDLDGTPPNVWRFRDRVFIGNGAGMVDKRGGAQFNTTIFSDDGPTPGANWAPRDSQFLAIHD